MLERCSASDFEEAKKEWEIEGIADSSSDDFSDKCQLCHTSHLEYNFVLHNRITGCKLSVGSTCIIRFNVIKGVVDVQSGVTILQNVADEQHWKNEIQTLVSSVTLPLTPDATVFNKFQKCLRKYFSVRGINNPTDEQLGQLMFGSNWSNKEERILYRMRDLWYKPGFIQTVKTKKLPSLSNPKEGQTWAKKRSLRTDILSAGRSSEFNVERHVVDKN